MVNNSNLSAAEDSCLTHGARSGTLPNGLAGEAGVGKYEDGDHVLALLSPADYGAMPCYYVS